MRKLIILELVVMLIIPIFAINYTGNDGVSPSTLEDSLIEEILDLEEVYYEVNISYEEPPVTVIVLDPPVVEVEDPVLVYEAFALSNLTAEDYDKMLVGTPLEGLGEAFYQLEYSYGINGLFAIGVCNLESSLGFISANTNNFFGFYYEGYMSFETPEEGILYFGKLMFSDIYRGKTIDEIGSIYCPPNDQWANLVKELMLENWEKLV